MNKTPWIQQEEKKTKVLHCLAELDQIEGVLGEDNGSGWAADRVRIVKQELEALLGRVEMARLKGNRQQPAQYKCPERKNSKNELSPPDTLQI